jgi:hypothetical protein
MTWPSITTLDAGHFTSIVLLDSRIVTMGESGDIVYTVTVAVLDLVPDLATMTTFALVSTLEASAYKVKSSDIVSPVMLYGQLSATTGRIYMHTYGCRKDKYVMYSRYMLYVHACV